MKPDPDEPKKVATFIASESAVMVNPALTKDTTKKRRRAQAADNIPVETDSSLNADTSSRHGRKKPKKDTAMKSDKAVLDPIGLSSPADKSSQAQEEERESLLHSFKQKPNKEAEQRAEISHNRLAKESLRSKSSNSVPKPPSTLDHPSLPKLSSILNEEYRKLNAASKTQRRSNSKHARVSSADSTQSDKSAISGPPVRKETNAQPSSNESRQSSVSVASVPKKELGGSEPRKSARCNSNPVTTDQGTPLRTVEPGVEPTTLEQQIKFLRVRTCFHSPYLYLTRWLTWISRKGRNVFSSDSGRRNLRY